MAGGPARKRAGKSLLRKPRTHQEVTVIWAIGFIVVMFMALFIPRTILAIVALSFMLGWWWVWVVPLVILALIIDLGIVFN